MTTWEELALPEEARATVDAVRTAALRVHREVGPGFRENVYQQCLAYELRRSGHVVDEKVVVQVRYGELTIPKAGEVDMIVDDRVIVELKAREAFHPAHTAQVVSYLRATGLPPGLLLNFHAKWLIRHGCERVAHPRFLP